jgi:methylmalonyl-CoA mutase N-terminal domain/subunit
VNKFAGQQDDEVEIQHIEEQAVKRQLDRLNELRANRDSDAVTNALNAVEDAAQGTDNLLPPMKEALRLRATLGEVSNTLRAVFGEYQPTH